MSAKYFWQKKDIYTPIPIDMSKSPVQEILGFSITPLLNKNLKSTMKFFHPNLNPPFQTLIISPLALMDYPTSYLIYSILSLTSGLTAAFLVSFEFTGAGFKLAAPLIFMIILLLYWPTWIN
ncbi:MAG TPA: hypothetical protein VE082_02640, partial [Desulfobaccales bacterium]|nr:hypothetical protein [Desulfobaccales bacterium]